MKSSRAGCLLLPKQLGLSLFLVSSILIGANAKLLTAEQPCAEEKIRPLLEVLRDKDLQKTDRTRAGWRRASVALRFCANQSSRSMAGTDESCR